MNTNEIMPTSVSTERRTARAGARALISVAIVLVAVILLNLLVSLLPATLTDVDLTENGLYSISATTKKLLSSLEEDVTVYVLGSNGRVADMPGRLLDRYTAASGHLDVKVVDATADAALWAEYPDVDVAALSNYSMLVVSNRRYTVVDFASARYYEVEGLGPVPAAQYEQLMTNTEILYYYYQYYGIDLTKSAPYYALEEQLTHAVEYVTAPVIPHMYVLEGSRPLGNMLTSFVEMVQPETEELSPDSVQAIPVTAAPLVIHAPTDDLSEATTQKVLDFIANGGKLLLITSPANAAMPNLARVTAAFGVTPIEGVLYEGNANNFKDVPTALLATVNAQHEVTNAFSAYGNPLVPNAHGIAGVAQKPEGMSVTELFTTSTSTYLIGADGKETTLGKTAVCVAAEHETTGASLVWLSSADAIDDAVINANSQIATAIFHVAMALDWQSEEFSSSLEAIEPVSMTETPMNVTDTVLIALGTVLVIAIPGVLLVAGIAIRIRRGRR